MTAKSDHHARAARMLSYALTLGEDPEIWSALAVVFEARLTQAERRRVLIAALRSAASDDVYPTLDEFIRDDAIGAPLPVLREIADDARWWADLATMPELKAWLTACFVRLPQLERQSFLASAARRAAA